jgi:hypothetical protein
MSIINKFIIQKQSATYNMSLRNIFWQNRQKTIRMQFFLIEIEIKISLLTKSGPQEGIYK